MGNLREIIFTGSFQSLTAARSLCYFLMATVFLCKETQERCFIFVKKIYYLMQICFSPRKHIFFNFTEILGGIWLLNLVLFLIYWIIIDNILKPCGHLHSSKNKN